MLNINGYIRGISMTLYSALVTCLVLTYLQKDYQVPGCSFTLFSHFFLLWNTFPLSFVTTGAKFYSKS